MTAPGDLPALLAGLAEPAATAGTAARNLWLVRLTEWLRHGAGEPGSSAQQRLLQLLDGTRDREALVQQLCADAGEGRFTLQKDGVAVSGAAEIRALVHEKLEPALKKMARYALLAG